MKNPVKWAAGISIGLVAVAGVACGSDGDDNTTMSPMQPPMSTSPSGANMMNTSETAAATLRSNLNLMLEEHVFLAGGATGAALGGRDADFKAAADTLDKNSVALSKAIGSVYGADAETAFLALWRKHIGFFVDYTQGVAAKDMAKQTKAVADLTQYSQDFGAFLSSANPNLPKDVVAKLVVDHVLTLKTVVDSQAAGDPAKAYTDMLTAASHMHMVADPLAAAIVKQFPEKFAGSTTSGGAGLRTTLNTGLQQHVYLAGFATSAALGGRMPEYEGAVKSLDANSVALSKAIGSVYGADAESAFLGLWRKHIGFFVDYTQGVAMNDKAKQDKAKADLTQYGQDFGAFLASANPNLTKDAVAKLLTGHVTTLTGAIDAQGAKDSAKAYGNLYEAAGHMHMVGDPLASAITKQFPDKFAVGITNLPGHSASAHAGHTP